MRSHARASRATAKRAGFALLAVVWGVGLISMLVVAFMTSGRLRLQTAFNIANATQASYIAEGAINRAALSLLSQREGPVTMSEAAVYDGSPKFCMLESAAVALAVEDEAGKIDLNAAPAEILRAALIGLGLDAGKAQAAASAIIAYRTTPGDVNAIAATAKTDKPIPPKQGMFETVLELDQVSGIDAPLYRALLPFVTVHSRAPGIDARASPPALFAALSGFPLEEVRALAAAPYPNALKRSNPRFPAAFNQAGDGGAYLIHAELRLASGQTAATDAIVDLRPPNGARFAIREIRRGVSRYAERLNAILAGDGAGVGAC